MNHIADAPGIQKGFRKPVILQFARIAMRRQPRRYAEHGYLRINAVAEVALPLQRWAMMLVGRIWRQVERLTAAGGSVRVVENGSMVRKYFEDLLASAYLAAGATQLVSM